jgi:hypothetical protein
MSRHFRGDSLNKDIIVSNDHSKPISIFRATGSGSIQPVHGELLFLRRWEPNNSQFPDNPLLNNEFEERGSLRTPLPPHSLREFFGGFIRLKSLKYPVYDSL